MKQIVQNLGNGGLVVTEGPAPLAQPGQVLIANAASLISAGTEKMAMDLARKSLLGKARERPDQVRRVLEKIRNEGLVNTFHAVRQRLDEPMPMGYSSAGIVLAAGAGVEAFKPGDRVASNGHHAEVVSVSANLCAAVPDNVSLDHAAFAVVGAIALHGVRLANVQLGETVLVIGLGLVGQLAVGLLNGAGCRVLGTDPDPEKCELARRMGATIAEPNLTVANVESLTGSLGADAVLIAAATKSNGPIELAAAAARKRGRIVLVGVVGLELDRRAFYYKELEFVVSCSYGPGRYDPLYEEMGYDYPAPYVRWTEQRNIEAVLQAMSAGRLQIEPLISHRFRIEDAEQAYQLIHDGSQQFLGVLLQYDTDRSRSDQVIKLGTAGKKNVDSRPSIRTKSRLGTGVIGAGDFARMVLIPEITRSPLLAPKILCSANGLTAVHSGNRHGFERATCDVDEVFQADDVEAVFSITPHTLHADHVLRALQARKHLYVEKPLCLSLAELEQLREAVEQADTSQPILMVGYNRRFAPLAQELRAALVNIAAPLTVSYRMNAGALPADHWTQLRDIGGGRIIGEACHAIDLVTWLTGSLPVRVFAESIGGPTAPEVTDDQCFITLRHQNGSVSSIGYLSGGDKACPKERIEVFGGGVAAILDDFRQLTVYRNGKRTVSKRGLDKGHRGAVAAFVAAVSGQASAPISWNELYGVSKASLLAVESLREGVAFEVASGGC